MASEKCVKGRRVILTVSLPFNVSDAFLKLCSDNNLNRSKLVSKIIEQYLKDLGVLSNGEKKELS